MPLLTNDLHYKLSINSIPCVSELVFNTGLMHKNLLIIDKKQTYVTTDLENFRNTGY